MRTGVPREARSDAWIGIGGDASRRRPSHTTGHTGPYHGGSIGLSLGEQAPAALTAREPSLGGELRPIESIRCEKNHRQGLYLVLDAAGPAASGECRIRCLSSALAIWRIRKEYQELSGNRPCHAKSLNFKAFFLEMAKVELRACPKTNSLICSAFYSKSDRQTSTDAPRWWPERLDLALPPSWGPAGQRVVDDHSCGERRYFSGG
jgi:hypothetical protein